MATIHYLALALTPGIGAKTARRLIEQFGSVEDIFLASTDELTSVPRVTPAIALELLASPLDQYEQELLTLDDAGLRAITLEDDSYPANLRLAADSPILLFSRGSVHEADSQAAAIVGSREASPAGSELARDLAERLAGHGLTIVSGLALGIDAAAHRGALNAQGRTLAVLGSGINVVHPRENADLAEEIVGRGALLSELHPNAPPSGPTLMARDRIVSGLARAVIVVEARAKGGSLDTAAKAFKQGRLVYAVPGSEGTEKLLQEGARRLDPAGDLEPLVQAILGHALGGDTSGSDVAAAQPRLL